MLLDSLIIVIDKYDEIPIKEFSILVSFKLGDEI